MSKNSKKKRDARILQEKRKKNKLKNGSSGNKIGMPSAPVMRMFKSPFSDLTEAERKVLISDISIKSRDKVTKLLDVVSEVLRKYDPITLLSILSGYGLTVGAGEQGVQSAESPERLGQADVELFQALVLQVPEAEKGTLPPTPDVISKMWEDLKALGQAFSFSRLSPEKIDDSETEQAISTIQEFIRGHTQSVRNWGYHSQIVNISTELYSYFDDVIQEKLGFTATSAISAFKSLLDDLEEKFTKRLLFLRDLKSTKDIGEMVRLYYEMTNQDVGEADNLVREFKRRKLSALDAFHFIRSHYDILMDDLFLIDLGSLAHRTNLSQRSISNILDYFSLSCGDLSESKREFFFFENPICKKPVILSNGLYYCMIPQIFFSFVLEIFDEIIETINKKALHDRRANYLEWKIEEIVNRRFPGSQVVSGLTWTLDDNTYETDLIAFIDSHAIIFEAKSQKISRPALRGAPDRIRRHLKEVLIEPGIQSARLEEKLNKLRLDDQPDDPILDRLPVDIKSINKIVRVSVSLEDFATLQTNLRLFKRTGWIPVEFRPCPSMNLADLETLFDLLEHPVQIIHYLTLRTELEGKFKILGDELDLLGLYRTTLFNVEYMSSDTEAEMMISGMSAPIDNYYMSRDQGIVISKPSPKISKLFKAIFERLEGRASPRWTEIGCILNRFPYDTQIALTSKINQLSKMVEKNWHIEGHKNIIVFNPPRLSEYSLAIVLFKNSNRERRYDFIETASAMALKPSNVRYCLVISFNIDDEELNYHSMGLFEDRDCAEAC